MDLLLFINVFAACTTTLHEPCEHFFPSPQRLPSSAGCAGDAQCPYEHHNSLQISCDDEKIINQLILESDDYIEWRSFRNVWLILITQC